MPGNRSVECIRLNPGQASSTVQQRSFRAVHSPSDDRQTGSAKGPELNTQAPNGPHMRNAKPEAGNSSRPHAAGPAIAVSDHWQPGTPNPRPGRPQSGDPGDEFPVIQGIKIICLGTHPEQLTDDLPYPRCLFDSMNSDAPISLGPGQRLITRNLLLLWLLHNSYSGDRISFYRSRM